MDERILRFRATKAARDFLSAIEAYRILPESERNPQAYAQMASAEPYAHAIVSLSFDLNTPVSELDVNPKRRKELSKKYKTLGDLVDAGRKNLLKVSLVGDTTIDLIERKYGVVIE